LNGTLRSSSPWIKSTGERQVFIEDIGEDSNARRPALGLAAGSYAGTKLRMTMFQSCTPCMSTPAAKRSDARERPIAVKYPPYDPPHNPSRCRSTSGRPHM